MSVFDTIRSITGAIVPAVGIVNSVVDLISGSRASVQPAGIGVAASPGFPGAPIAGTSVGPQAIQAGFGGTLVAPVGALAGTLIRRVAGPAAVVGALGTIAQDIVGGNGARPTTRRAQILAVARSNNPGATAKKIIRSARECGIELASATFGLNVLDVCFLIAQPPTRRSRGISAADMRRTRSTIRKVTTIQHQLKSLSGPIRRRK